MINNRKEPRSVLVATSASLLGLMLIAGCGNASTTQGASTESESPSPEPSQTTGLPSPTKPGDPEVRDISEIRLPLEGDQAIAPAPVRSYEDYDVDQRNPVNTISGFYGYTGPLYSQLQWDTGMTVLEPTIGIDETSTWGAALLVRNDTLQTVGAVTVTAQLRGSDGQVLDTASATSPVPEARAGEPIPVSVTSDVPKSEVAEVHWSTKASAAPSGTERHLKSLTPPALPYGDREPLKTELYDESGQSSPYPYIQGLDVKPTSNGSDLVDITNVIAWMNNNGQIVDVAPAEPSWAPESPQQYRNGSGYLAIVRDPGTVRHVEATHVLWWGVGWTQ